MFKALGKQEKYRRLQGVCDDASWLMQQFAEMICMRRYTLIKVCPRSEDLDWIDEEFSFHPLIFEEKVYSVDRRTIKVKNYTDDRLVTTLPGHDYLVSCLIIDDGK